MSQKNDCECGFWPCIHDPSTPANEDILDTQQFLLTLQDLELIDVYDVETAGKSIDRLVAEARIAQLEDVLKEYREDKLYAHVILQNRIAELKAQLEGKKEL